MRLRLALAMLVLALTPLAPPLLAAGHPLTALLLRSFFSRLCHQDAGRSFVLAGSPVAVCARCLGIYCGVVSAGMLNLGKGTASRLLALAMLLNLLDVASEATHGHGNLALARLVLGMMLGVGAGAFLFLPQGLLAERPRPGG